LLKKTTRNWIHDLVKEENTVVPNEVLWKTILCLPGTEIPNRPLSYNTEDLAASLLQRPYNNELASAAS